MGHDGGMNLHLPANYFGVNSNTESTYACSHTGHPCNSYQRDWSQGNVCNSLRNISEPILMVRATKLDWLLQLWPFSGHFGDVKWRVWGWKIRCEMAFSPPSGQDLLKQLWTATCHICRPPAAASWGKSKSNCFGFPRPLFFFLIVCLGFIEVPSFFWPNCGFFSCLSLQFVDAKSLTHITSDSLSCMESSYHRTIIIITIIITITQPCPFFGDVGSFVPLEICRASEAPKVYRTMKVLDCLPRWPRTGQLDGVGINPWIFCYMGMGQYLNTIISGMNIHLPAILGFTRYQGFDPSPYEYLLSPAKNLIFC